MVDIAKFKETFKTATTLVGDAQNIATNNNGAVGAANAALQLLNDLAKDTQIDDKAYQIIADNTATQDATAAEMADIDLQIGTLTADQKQVGDEITTLQDKQAALQQENEELDAKADFLAGIYSLDISDADKKAKADADTQSADFSAKQASNSADLVDIGLELADRTAEFGIMGAELEELATRKSDAAAQAREVENLAKLSTAELIEKANVAGEKAKAKTEAYEDTAQAAAVSTTSGNVSAKTGQVCETAGPILNAAAAAATATGVGAWAAPILKALGTVANALKKPLKVIGKILQGVGIVLKTVADGIKNGIKGVLSNVKNMTNFIRGFTSGGSATASDGASNTAAKSE